MFSGLVFTNLQTHDDKKGKPELVFDDEVPKCLHGLSPQWFSLLMKPDYTAKPVKSQRRNCHTGIVSQMKPRDFARFGFLDWPNVNGKELCHEKVDTVLSLYVGTSFCRRGVIATADR